MSDLLAIVAVWSGLLGVPALGVVAYNTYSSAGRWPWEYGAGIDDVVGAMTAFAWVRGHEYLDGWAADWREGEVGRRVAAFILSFGLLYRAGIHSLVAALSYPDGPPGEVDHGLVWTPLPMARTPLWTARVLTVGSGLVLAYMTGWPVWGWPAWVQWVARAYLFAQCGVWLAEPIAILREINHAT
jgi:hypothetical protein